MLRDIRVLDLTDERGIMCGRILADLGADVVQVEPTEGSTARQTLPTDGEEVDSFVWHAFAAGKRSVTIDFDDEQSLEKLQRLAMHADIVVTSFDRPDLKNYGLDPGDLLQAAPQVIIVTITAFGWDGPKAHYESSDLTIWAAAGPLAPHRDGDRPPVGLSVPQAYLHAGADAAVGVLLALSEKWNSGAGQHVDVSAQVSVSQATLARILADSVGDDNPEWQRSPTDRSGSGAATPNSYKKWFVQDGLVELHLSMGAAAGDFTNRFFSWMKDEDKLPQGLESLDWRLLPDQIANGEQESSVVDQARDAVRAFLSGKTKADVLDAALERRLLCIPILTLSDVIASEHLHNRRVFESVDIAGRQALLPAHPAVVHGAPSPRLSDRAPYPGEHNHEVFAEWVGQKAQDVTRQTPSRGRNLPLQGLRVLDLSWVVAGPLIGRTLADFGADVIRIESSRRIDTARMMQPFHDGHPDRESSALYGNCNAGKRGMTLNLAMAEGQQIVRELAAQSDVLIESFSPGQLAKWGLSPRTLRAENPNLIVLSTSIAGQDGPWSKLAGFGNVGSSLSGFQLLGGWPDRLPLGPFGPYTDYLGPRMSLATLLAALHYRKREERGCTIDVAQVESGVYFLAPQVAQASRDGIVPNRCGNSSPQYAPQGVYQGCDGLFVAITVLNTKQWHILADVIGRPDFIEREDLDFVVGRKVVEADLDEAIAKWTAQHSALEVEKLLQSRGVAAHLAQGPAEYSSDPQILHRRHLVELSHPIHESTVVEGARVNLSCTPGGPRKAAPTLGQHTTEILREELGYSFDRIQALDEQGVLT